MDKNMDKKHAYNNQNQQHEYVKRDHIWQRITLAGKTVWSHMTSNLTTNGQ